MDKCRLCGEININFAANETSIEYEKKEIKEIKILIGRILKFEGYETPADKTASIWICEECHKRLEEFAEFLKVIKNGQEKRQQQHDDVVDESNDYPATNSMVDNKCELINNKLKISVKTKSRTINRKNKHDSRTNTTVDSHEVPLTKRIRRPPKRFLDNLEYFPVKPIKILKQETITEDTIPSSSLSLLPKIATLRLDNHRIMGQLVETCHHNEHSSKFRILCNFCPLVFRFVNEFRKHLEKHEDKTENPIEDVTVNSKENFFYYCEICQKSFTEHFAVRRHYKQTHSHEKNLQCGHCTEKFKYKSTLSYHVAKHLDRKRFECSHCHKKFIMRYELQVHQRTHTKEKPYKCQICSMSFAHPSNLVKHTELHKQRSPKKCSKCQASFKNLDYLKKHEKKHVKSKENLDENTTAFQTLEENNETQTHSEDFSKNTNNNNLQVCEMMEDDGDASFNNSLPDFNSLQSNIWSSRLNSGEDLESSPPTCFYDCEMSNQENNDSITNLLNTEKPISSPLVKILPNSNPSDYNNEIILYNSDKLKTITVQNETDTCRLGNTSLNNIPPTTIANITSKTTDNLTNIVDNSIIMTNTISKTTLENSPQILENTVLSSKNIYKLNIPIFKNSTKSVLEQQNHVTTEKEQEKEVPLINNENLKILHNSTKSAASDLSQENSICAQENNLKTLGIIKLSSSSANSRICQNPKIHIQKNIKILNSTKIPEKYADLSKSTTNSPKKTTFILMPEREKLKVNNIAHTDNNYLTFPRSISLNSNKSAKSPIFENPENSKISIENNIKTSSIPQKINNSLNLPNSSNSTLFKIWSKPETMEITETLDTINNNSTLLFSNSSTSENSTKSPIFEILENNKISRESNCKIINFTSITEKNNNSLILPISTNSTLFKIWSKPETMEITETLDTINKNSTLLLSNSSTCENSTKSPILQNLKTCKISIENNCETLNSTSITEKNHNSLILPISTNSTLFKTRSKQEAMKITDTCNNINNNSTILLSNSSTCENSTKSPIFENPENNKISRESNCEIMNSTSITEKNNNSLILPISTNSTLFKTLPKQEAMKITDTCNNINNNSTILLSNSSTCENSTKSPILQNQETYKISIENNCEMMNSASITEKYSNSLNFSNSTNSPKKFTLVNIQKIQNLNISNAKPMDHNYFNTSFLNLCNSPKKSSLVKITANQNLITFNNKMYNMPTLDTMHNNFTLHLSNSSNYKNSTKSPILQNQETCKFSIENNGETMNSTSKAEKKNNFFNLANSTNSSKKSTLDKIQNLNIFNAKHMNNMSINTSFLNVANSTNSPKNSKLIKVNANQNLLTLTDKSVDNMCNTTISGNFWNSTNSPKKSTPVKIKEIQNLNNCNAEPTIVNMSNKTTSSLTSLNSPIIAVPNTNMKTFKYVKLSEEYFKTALKTKRNIQDNFNNLPLAFENSPAIKVANTKNIEIPKSEDFNSMSTLNTLSVEIPPYLSWQDCTKIPVTKISFNDGVFKSEKCLMSPTIRISKDDLGKGDILNHPITNVSYNDGIFKSEKCLMSPTVRITKDDLGKGDILNTAISATTQTQTSLGNSKKLLPIKMIKTVDVTTNNFENEIQISNIPNSLEYNEINRSESETIYENESIIHTNESKEQILTGDESINSTPILPTSLLGNSPSYQNIIQHLTPEKSTINTPLMELSKAYSPIEITSKPVTFFNINTSNMKNSSTKKSSKNSLINKFPIKTVTITKDVKNMLHQRNSAATQKISTPTAMAISPTIICNISKTPLKYNQSLLKPLHKHSSKIQSASLNTPRNIAILTTPPAPPPATSSSFYDTLLKTPTTYKFQCSYCLKYFKLKSSLTRHFRTHTGEKPYKCNLCPKSYADGSNYKKHKILHKKAANALNITLSPPHLPESTTIIQSSPTHSIASDPDPDGIEIMQTIKKFGSTSSIDADGDIESLTSSDMESYMWQDALDHALINDDIRENIKRNLSNICGGSHPLSSLEGVGVQTLADNTTNIFDASDLFSSENPD